MARYFLLFIGILIVGCTDFGENVPPILPIEQLLAAPETLSVGAKSVYLSTYLQIDFMPKVPPQTPDLSVVVFVQTADSTQPPSSAEPDIVWIVYKQQVWAAFLHDRTFPNPNTITKIAFGGPQWDGPVDVIVRISRSRTTYQLLRASNQLVDKTY